MKRSVLLTICLFFVASAWGRHAPKPPDYRGPVDPSVRRINVIDIDTDNRVHRAGSMWMNITNWGYFGNSSVTNEEQMEDPEYPGTWAPQCEFPGGSEDQYLYQGSLWLGAMIQDEGFQFPRVSTGSEGWIFPRIHEFYPGETPDPVVERTTRPNAYNRLGDFISSDSAVSEQDFIVSYSDTLTDAYYVETDPLDGGHYPLGIKVTQTSYSWSYAYARDFIIIDWEIENIADNYLKNLYVGLYIDADVGEIYEQTRGGLLEGHTDDVCGFQKYYYYENADGIPDSAVINTAWIADNDGRYVDITSGSDFATPHVTGVRVVRAPNPRLKTSFNWWISNTDDNLDFGPAWEDDNSQSDWTTRYGTPLGDARKYFVLSNREFDYDQTYSDNADWIADNPQTFVNPVTGATEEHAWKIFSEDEAGVMQDLQNGYDTRYLLSWGPLGIYDFTDESGQRVYRLNPGEKFSMTVGYVAGENFHDRNHPQPTNAIIDPSLYNFADLRYNADWVAKVYDNPMVDTDGDGWYGEDTGIDYLYAENRGDSVVIEGVFIGIYPGPDEGEGDSRLQEEEDDNPYKPTRFDYTTLNGMLDHGDGVPDFQGPPPPPIPDIQYEAYHDKIVITWKPMPSEDPDYRDPFSRVWDFEGYSLYSSATGLEAEYSFLATYDREDYAYYSDNDSLLCEPFPDKTNYPLDSLIEGTVGHLKAVGPNVGFDDIWNEATQQYEFELPHAHPMMPMWYAVTVFDFGDHKSGTPSLESSKGAACVYIAPSGSPDKKPGVVPNPYRADQNYTVVHGNGLAWENRDDGTVDYFPSLDRRMYFYNLPEECLIRIFTVSGDLVQILPHNIAGDQNSTEQLDYAEAWDLNSRNQQQVVSGLYIFSVEDMTDENKGDVELGKFVIIR